MVSEQEQVLEGKIVDEGIPVDMHSDPASSILAAASSVWEEQIPA